jgi:hypothetical protein
VARLPYARSGATGSNIFESMLANPHQSQTGTATCTLVLSRCLTHLAAYDE